MENLENQNVQEPAQQAPAQEPAAQEPKAGTTNNVEDISTKEALKALGRNAKARAKKTWEWAKPKLKVVATVGAIAGVGAYVYSELTQPEVSNSGTKCLEPTPLDLSPNEFNVTPMEPALQTPMQEPALQGPEQVTENVVNPE